MHLQALQWLDACRKRLSVCDLGAFNVNGSADVYFPGWDYVGVDIRPGPGVSVVADAATWDARGRLFDVVVSCEMFEHCEQWQEVVKNAFKLTKPGGYFFGTTAGPKREPHNSDGGADLGSEYYGNIEPDILEIILNRAGFVRVVVDHLGDDVRWIAERDYAGKGLLGWLQ
jgi:SAM-dependent methyltransferase